MNGGEDKDMSLLPADYESLGSAGKEVKDMSSYPPQSWNRMPIPAQTVELRTCPKDKRLEVSA